MKRNILLAGLLLAASSSLAQYKVIHTWKVGGAGGWDYLTIEPTSRRLFISRFDRIDVYNVDSGTAIGTIPNLKGVHQAVFDTKHDHGFTSNGGENTATVFDLKTLKEITRIPVGKNPDAEIFDAASDRIFTFNAGTEDATAIDAATLKVVGSVPLGGKPEFPQVDGQGHLFVNVEDKNQILEFNTKTLKVDKTWSIAPGDGPSGLAFDVKHNRLFSVTDGKMMVSDSKAGKVVATVPIGDGPDAAAFDPKTQLAYSSNGAGTLTVVHEDSPDKFTVVQNVATQRSARTCVLDPKTGHIILVAADVKQVEGQRRRQMVPGSFVILVVGRS